MSVRDALAAATARLGGGEDARTDAEWLLAHALGVGLGWLFAHATDALESEAAVRFDALVAARAAGTPVAHLRGRQGFWSLELEVAPATLIPRGDTERLVELALERLPADAPARVLDLGTGSGAIALAIARERPRAEVTAIDASAAALAVARRNAAALGLARVRMLEGDWFAPVAGEVFAMVCSNPPYLADDDVHLALGDLRFEPRGALASGPDGLDDLRRIVAAAPAHLAPGGWLLLEHGWTQGEAVRALLAQAGFVDVHTARDLEGRERVGLGRRPA